MIELEDGTKNTATVIPKAPRETSPIFIKYFEKFAAIIEPRTIPIPANAITP